MANEPRYLRWLIDPQRLLDRKTYFYRNIIFFMNMCYYRKDDYDSYIYRNPRLVSAARENAF